MKERLTEEQERIIHHPLGHHARVLAVAGSGKTTTMVHRVRHLVLDLNQDPKRIRIVMFNRLAREDFEQKLAEQIPDLGKRPPVLTFHGLAYRMYRDAQEKGLLPPMELWVGEKVDYTLSRSFRFGPLLAQSAYNVIALNRRRETKPLAAHNLRMPTGITVLTWQDRDRAAREMAQEIVRLVRDHHVPPHRIGVLGRTYAQLGNLQSVFIEANIPFRVVGDVPFFDRDENRTLVDYIRVAQHLDQPPSAMKPWGAALPVEDEEEPAQARSPLRHRFRPGQSPCGEAVRAVLAVANTPSRMLLRSVLQNAVEKGHDRGWSLGRSLEALLDPHESPLPAERRENMQALIDLLTRIRERILQEPDLKAGDLLNWIVEHTRYLEHFSHYYGEGLESSLRKDSVQNFISFATRTGMNVPDFVRHLGTLDTTRGLPPRAGDPCDHRPPHQRAGV